MRKVSHTFHMLDSCVWILNAQVVNRDDAQTALIPKAGVCSRTQRTWHALQQTWHALHFDGQEVL